MLQHIPIGYISVSEAEHRYNIRVKTKEKETKATKYLTNIARNPLCPFILQTFQISKKRSYHVHSWFWFDIHAYCIVV